MVLKKVGYFLPVASLQLLHLAHSRVSFWNDFVCNDLVSWLYVYTFTRFLFEPFVHCVSALAVGAWVSSYGVASHVLMTCVLTGGRHFPRVAISWIAKQLQYTAPVLKRTSSTMTLRIRTLVRGTGLAWLPCRYVSWGFALLVTDRRWFTPPRPAIADDAAAAAAGRGGDAAAITGAAKRWGAVHTGGLALVALSAFLYTWMAFITCRYYHNPMDWVLAVVTASMVLGLLAMAVRRARSDPGTLGRIVGGVLAAETVLAVLLVAGSVLLQPKGSGSDNDGDNSSLHTVLQKSLKYAFWVQPLAARFYFVAAGFVAFAAFVRCVFVFVVGVFITITIPTNTIVLPKTVVVVVVVVVVMNHSSYLS